MTREFIKYMIWGALLFPVFFGGLFGCFAMVEPGNQAIIEWKSK